jgi:hypothetical protein
MAPPRISQIVGLWQHGFMLLLLLAVALLAGAVAVGLPLLLAGELFGLGEDWAQRWLLILSPLWAPIWAGYLASGLQRYLPGARELQREAPQPFDRGA